MMKEKIETTAGKTAQENETVNATEQAAVADAMEKKVEIAKEALKLCTSLKVTGYDENDVMISTYKYKGERCTTSRQADYLFSFYNLGYSARGRVRNMHSAVASTLIDFLKNNPDVKIYLY